MAILTKPIAREIIDDFAKEIRTRRLETAKPSKTVINFRTDVKDGKERDICRVPIGLLRYRKDKRPDIARLLRCWLEGRSSNRILADSG